MTTSYDRRPTVTVGGGSGCVAGWDGIASRLGRDGRVIVVDAYPGVSRADLAPLRDRLRPDLFIDTATLLRPPAAIDALVGDDLTDDPVFGRLSSLAIADFFDPSALAAATAAVAAADGRVLVTGPGAALVSAGDVLAYAELPRWEAQQRHRRGAAGNLGAGNAGTSAPALYKRAYFVDWRVADRHKQCLWPRLDYLLDTVVAGEPKLLAATSFFDALAATSRRPFRVVPFFDPAPWGGEWLRRVCGLDHAAPNYGWCFDCVPEENSLLLAFGRHRVEVPAVDLVLKEPVALLGQAVVDRFGAEFPIRFDMLDTMGGGHLSLQVHPLTAYINAHFGVAYTQDESYYLLDAEPDASVYLGLREGIDRGAFASELRAAAESGGPFDAERHVNRFAARRHDHFLIPAGTVHCSGAGSLVLEISATPYIFTFKLWDWGRPGLDGRPRPLHIDHGLANIQWARTTSWVERNLVNRTCRIASGDGWVEERTGLHEAEFIETRRHWFDRPVRHERTGGVEVLNLVEGDEAVVESPDAAFDPFVVHYAETFILPAAAGPYSVAPSGPAAGRRWATVKAYVR